MRNRTILKFVLTFLILIIFGGELFSQEEPNIEFGVYSPEEFNSTGLTADTNASAIILYELGNAYFDQYLNVVFERHVKVKILNKAGYRYGTVKIKFRSGKYKETVSEIEGYTAYLDDKGNIQTRELNDDDIIEENIDKDFSAMVFTFPSLQPNCIVEFKYKTKSEYMLNFPREWVFQHDEPVLWSEYRTEVPTIYGFAVFEQKTHPFYINDLEDYSKSYSIKDVSGASIFLSGYRKRLVMKDIPAFRSEPYMKSADNYVAKVTYQLAAYNPPFSSSQKIMQSWKELGKSLIKEDEYFGGRIKGTSTIREKAEVLTASISDKDLKLQAIYDFVKSSMIWNDNYSIYANDLDDVFAKKKGDSGDINLLLTAMLKSIGIETHPIILSTRQNGPIYQDYPILRQFNDIIVYANTGNKEYVLDATDKMRPYFLLPKAALNDVGLLILPDSTEWVKLIPQGKEVSVKLASVGVNEDGSLGGIMRITDEGYSALSARHKIEESDSKEYLKEALQSGKTNIAYSDLKITGKDEIDKALIIDSKLASQMYSQVQGNMIYFNPCFLGRMEDNPFKSEKRVFPVDYAYPIDLYYKVNIVIPDSFKVNEYPKNTAFMIGKNDAGYERETVLNGNMLQYYTHFFVNKTTFMPDEYQELRKFYDQVIAADAEIVVLQK